MILAEAVEVELEAEAKAVLAPQSVPTAMMTMVMVSCTTQQTLISETALVLAPVMTQEANLSREMEAQEQMGSCPKRNGRTAAATHPSTTGSS